jgi:hypothetical protein
MSNDLVPNPIYLHPDQARLFLIIQNKRRGIGYRRPFQFAMSWLSKRVRFARDSLLRDVRALSRDSHSDLARPLTESATLARPLRLYR